MGQYLSLLASSSQALPSGPSDPLQATPSSVPFTLSTLSTLDRFMGSLEPCHDARDAPPVVDWPNGPGLNARGGMRRDEEGLRRGKRGGKGKTMEETREARSPWEEEHWQKLETVLKCLLSMAGNGAAVCHSLSNKNFLTRVHRDRVCGISGIVSGARRPSDRH